MSIIDKIRSTEQSVLGVGNYVPGFQAQLDFDFLSGKASPSLKAVVTTGRRNLKLFWGDSEILIPCFTSFQRAKQTVGAVNWLFNTTSSRRALSTTREFFKEFPDAIGGHIFAEGVTEIDALSLYHEFQVNGKLVVGPAGVGLIVPGYLKLGVIGGIDHRQLEKNHLGQPGTVAIISASGGMMNEIITQVVQSGSGVSFALCVGGDRFPSTRPVDAFLLAEQDPQTEAIVYYGELGGQDEYEVVDQIKKGSLTKPILAYIAGTIGEQFTTSIQFGHAKALANSKSESSSAKRQALASVGANASHSVKEFVEAMKDLPKAQPQSSDKNIGARRASLFSSTISKESGGEYQFVGRSLVDWAHDGNLGKEMISGLLGHVPASEVTSNFFGLIFSLSVDHGPQVSGALNTIITARAGKDMVDALAAGLLTIGPRFGGAVSAAASTWHTATTEGQSANEILGDYSKRSEPIPGIGHKKYSSDLPDPRVKLIDEFLRQNLSQLLNLNKAREVEALTLEKKTNLILNVDGIIAAGMLDVLKEQENYSDEQMSELISSDFFSALFVIPRTVGLVSHYLDQRRLDEGLFRLPDDDVALL